MSYCFRMCLTNNASNAIPITPPPDYNVAKLELLRRELLAATQRGITLSLRSMFLTRQLSSAPSSARWPPGRGGDGAGHAGRARALYSCV